MLCFTAYNKDTSLDQERKDHCAAECATLHLLPCLTEHPDTFEFLKGPGSSEGDESEEGQEQEAPAAVAATATAEDSSGSSSSSSSSSSSDGGAEPGGEDASVPSQTPPPTDDVEATAATIAADGES